MAAVGRDDVILISVPGTEWVDRGYAQTDFTAGDLVLIDDTPHPTREFDMQCKEATGTEAHGIALKDCTAGGQVEFARICELDGFIGLTPGNGYTIVGGVIDDTAPAAGAFVKFRARNATSLSVVLH